MNDSTSNISGVVLAGGSSRRFGSDKRRAKFRGKPLIVSAFDALSVVLDNVYLSVDGQLLLKDINDLRAEHGSPLSENHLIRDLASDQGPLGGIYSAMKTLKTDWFLVLATDLPCVNTASLEILIEHTSKDCLAVVATDSTDKLQPLLGCYSRRLLPYIGAAIDRNEYGVIRLLKQVAKKAGSGSIVYVSFPARELLNINRQEDLNR